VSDLDDLRESVAGTRSTVKALIRTARGALGMLTDLERRLAALENAEPEEAERDEHVGAAGAERTRQYAAVVG
jgi:hypothetical protein